MWLSLVERLVRAQEVAGSNPVTPMKGKSRNSISRFFLYNFELINIDVLIVLVFCSILVLKSVANPLDK